MVRQGKGKFRETPPPVTTHHEFSNPKGDGPGGGPRIREYRALQKMPRAEEALQILLRVGAVVRPLMIKHGWTLPLLAEFLPKQENLLGVNYNRGQKICLRLRWNGSTDAFLDEEQIIHTMLHELTHNHRGPHDEVFYKFLDALTEEYWDLKRKGFVHFEAFGGAAFRVGGSVASRAPPLALARKRAADQAEKRRQKASLGIGGGRLGGPPASSTAAKTPAQLAAEAAERRRNKLPAACPESEADTARAVQEAEEDEVIRGIEVITIRDEDDEPDVWVLDDEEDVPPAPPVRKKELGALPQGADRKNGPSALPQGAEVVELGSSSSSEGEGGADAAGDDSVVITAVRGAPPAAKRARGAGSSSSAGGSTSGAGSSGAAGLEPWACGACALRNAARALRCAACDAERPRALTLGLSRRRLALGALKRGGTASAAGAGVGATAGARTSASITARASASASTTARASAGASAHGAQSHSQALPLPAVPGPQPWQCASCRFEMTGDLAQFWMCRRCGEIRQS